MHARLPEGPYRARRLALAAFLPALLAGALWSAAPQARAQTSTPVYGSDTQEVAYVTPSLRLGANASYDSSGELKLGEQGQFSTTFGSAYDPDPVDVSQGFVARLKVFTNGGNGVALVVKNPSVATDVETPAAPAYGTIYGLGAYGLPSSLGVAFITFHQTKNNANDRHYKAVEVFADDANGNATVLADVTGLDLDEDVNGNSVLQVRYIPKFSTLDVYVGSRLIARVPNVDLGALGIAVGGQAELGVTGGVPADDYANAIDYFPAYLQNLSIGNQLVFGAGFGPNLYEDRFPFLTTGQSVWGQGSDSLEYKKFLGASSGYDNNGNPIVKTSKTLSSSLKDVYDVSASAFASYDVGIGIDATATGGTADISYPLFLDMEFPAQYSVPPGTPFTLPMLFYPDASATISTTTPTANVTADLKCITDFGVNLDASLFGQSLTSGQLFNIPINVPDTTFFDAQKILTSGLIPNVNGGVNYAGYVQGDEGETGTKNPHEDGTPGKGSSSGAEGAGSEIAKFINVGITIPDLSTSGAPTFTGNTGTHLTSSASSPFVTLSSDFTNSILAEIPGLNILTYVPFFNNDYTLNLGSHTLELGSHFCDIYGNVNVGAQVSYDFAPAPQVYLTLTAPTAGYPQYLGPYALDTASGKLLSPPALTMPADGSPLTVTPSVVLTSTFQPSASVTIGGALSINPLSLSFGLDSDTFSTDPYFGFPLTVSGSVKAYTFPTTPFTIGTDSGGVANAVPFQTSLQGKSFTLFSTDADNPVIDSVTPAQSLVQPAGAGGSVAIDAAAEHSSYYGYFAWDYDGNPNDPQTTLPNWTRTVDADGSAASITASIPDTLLTAQGTHTITLINTQSDGSSPYASNLETFTVNAPVPALSQLHPDITGGQALAGGKAFLLDALGTNFSPPVAPTNGSTGYPGSVVFWNGKPLKTTYHNPGRLTAAVPSGLIAFAGTAQITVLTTGPGGGTSAPQALTIFNPRPILSSLSQTVIAPGRSSLTLTLNGTGFVQGASVLVSDGTTTSQRKARYVSTGALALTLSADELSRPVTLVLQVQNPAPGGGLSEPRVLTIGAYPAGGTVIVIPSATRGPNGIGVTLTVVNTSQTAPATSTALFRVSVGGNSTTGQGAVYPTAPNPLHTVLLGTIPANGSVTLTPDQVFTFPASLGASGRPVLLTVTGSSSGQAFTSRLRVVLP